jgi:hypothetical protein
MHKIRGRVSKLVTTESKTAVMDVIGFLCVSLSKNTIHLYENLGNRSAYACSESGFSSQNGHRALRVYYRRAAFSFAFLLWGKRLTANDIHKK